MTTAQIIPFQPKARRKRIFVIEDDPLMAMLLDDVLDVFGYEVAAMSAFMEDALSMLETQQFDAAILDINIHGFMCYEIAEQLQKKGIPFLFSTGYHPTTLPKEYQDCPTLQKPYDINQLKVQLDKILK